MKIIRKIWWRLFPPRETSATAAHVYKFLDRHAGISRAVIDRRIATDLANAELMIYAIRDKGSKPSQFALLLIRNALEEQLSSGAFHIYRGTLSQVGIDLLRTLREVVSDLKSQGEMADVDEDDYFKFIREQIQLAG